MNKKSHPWIRFADSENPDDGSTPSSTGQGSAPKPTPPENSAAQGKRISEMTDAERADFFEARSNRLKSSLQHYSDAGITSVEELQKVLEKASKHDDLQHELMSDRDKAVHDAKEQAAQSMREEFLPRLIHAELKAAAAGKVALDRLEEAIEFTDLKRFAQKDGNVDAEKVERFIASLGAEVKDEPARRGPSPVGAGHRGSTGSSSSVSAGRELYQQKKR